MFSAWEVISGKRDHAWRMGPHTFYWYVIMSWQQAINTHHVCTSYDIKCFMLHWPSSLRFEILINSGHYLCWEELAAQQCSVTLNVVGVFSKFMARDERNLKWDSLDQIKLDANVHLSTSAWQQQTGRNGLAKIVLQIIGWLHLEHI